MEKLEANIQLINYYIENSNIHINETYLPDGSELNYSIEVNISNIIRENDTVNAQVKLTHKINAEKKECDIYATIVGDFIIKNIEDDKDCEKLLKFNGVPILSEILRAYMISISALSGIKNITFPIINYNHFFKDAKVE